MYPPFHILVPKTVSEVIDTLLSMMIGSPKFEDLTGYFPGRSIDTTFFELNEGLRLIKGKLGEETYVKLREMSDRMRAHFEADPDDKTEESLKGREIIVDMVDIIKQASRKRRSVK